MESSNPGDQTVVGAVVGLQGEAEGVPLSGAGYSGSVRPGPEGVTPPRPRYPPPTPQISRPRLALPLPGPRSGCDNQSMHTVAAANISMT